MRILLLGLFIVVLIGCAKSEFPVDMNVQSIKVYVLDDKVPNKDQVGTLLTAIQNAKQIEKILTAMNASIPSTFDEAIPPSNHYRIEVIGTKRTIVYYYQDPVALKGTMYTEKSGAQEKGWITSKAFATALLGDARLPQKDDLVLAK
ncbi:hypothetical protein [Cohnella yongneupensis]|uniref:Lipoprotein n=1 Tax=Cohnella yongneupensis TaxID=425006 RepID=A0ABW0R1Y3_9BACL